MYKAVVSAVVASLLVATPVLAAKPSGSTQQVTGGQPTCQLSASPLTFHPTVDQNNPIWNVETVTWNTTKVSKLVWKMDGFVVSGIPTTPSGTYTFDFWYLTPYDYMSLTLEVYGSSANKFTACTVNLTAI